jgi:DNA-binding CsgD family transcriptional regulator/tetratricopeptide (TPR) repeat protein
MWLSGQQTRHSRKSGDGRTRRADGLRENRGMAASPPLVGRACERMAIATALHALREGRGGIVAIEGEPGIGKSRLLAYLEAAADGCTVVAGRASEFEADLPYALWTEALDRHLAEAGERRLSRLGLADPAALGVALPALAELAPAQAHGDRHRTHRALRDLLERLAASRPLVLCLDDVHWADSASVDALAALVRRPPRARVLLSVAAREGQLPVALAAALSAALREDRLIRLVPAPLSEREAAELVGEAAVAIYPQSGGNPFYLEQLARTGGGAHAEGAIAADGSVPAAVAAALESELAALTPEARRLLDAAAVAGDPFEPALAAEVAELSEASGLAALDELLGSALARPTGVPRLFAFRHPVVRHAVYGATPPGWRLGAHSRAALALARRGAGPVERAHHVEQAARAGDEDAISLLATAAAGLQSPAPGVAARFHAAAVRLLPERPEARQRRTRMLGALAEAQAAAGDAAAAHETLLEALRGARGDERLALTVGVANAEWWLGRNDEARRRLQVALGDLPAQPSPDRIRLRLALALTALEACDLDEVLAQASDARDDARAIGDPVFEAAALAGGALARVTAAQGPGLDDALHESTTAIERLTGEQLATRLPAFWMHGRARHALGRFDAALADFERASAIAADTGRARVLLMLSVESVRTLIELGRLAEARAAAEEGVERARLSGIPRMLLWAQSALSSARLAAGDVQGALRHGREAAETGAPPGFHAAGQPGWCLGAALTAAGNPEQAVEAMSQAFGGPALAEVLPVQRPLAAGDLVEGQLACGDIAAAEETVARGEAAASRGGTAWAAAVTALARAAVLRARERPREAVAACGAARESAAGAPLLSARARLAHGQALAAAGDRRAAVEALVDAEAGFDRFGARRRRDEAVRELRRLGHRVLRPAREGSAGPLAPLTAREREIAELVSAGRTNREIAEQLVLSTRTIEAHLRNIFGKLGVRSRVELTRATERAGRDAG